MLQRVKLRLQAGGGRLVQFLDQPLKALDRAQGIGDHHGIGLLKQHESGERRVEQRARLILEFIDVQKTEAE